MRTITDTQRQALEDLSAEGQLCGMPIQTAEKDIHITELLRRLSALQIWHDHFSDLARQESSRHDSGIRLIFAGGTCLSKAYGLIHRMSEDIDIKVVLDPPARPLKKGRGNRVRLTALHQAIPKLLAELGLPLSRYDDGRDNPHIRDSHRYYAIGAQYQAAFPQHLSLRPELKLEFIERPPLLPVEPRQFGYLYERLAGLPSASPLSISCLSVAETAAEKVLSLLRRCAYQWAGYQKDGLDPVLVRHIYDVACIAEQSPESLAAAESVFMDLVDKDREEFERQNPDFAQAPLAILRNTLATAKSHPELERNYDRKLLPLVYGDWRPSYTQAFATFEQVAERLLKASAL